MQGLHSPALSADIRRLPLDNELVIVSLVFPRRYCVLEIFPRELSHESKDERTRRVIAAYEGLGIPTWRQGGLASHQGHTGRVH
jgi:hypothetical protein